MITWLLKQYMTWYVDRRGLPGSVCYPQWVRGQIEKNPKLKRHEEWLLSITERLRSASPEHLEKNVVLNRRHEPLFINQTTPSKLRPDNGIRSAMESGAKTYHHLEDNSKRHRQQGRFQSWGAWQGLSIAVGILAVLFVGMLWMNPLSKNVVQQENEDRVNEIPSENRMRPDSLKSQDAERLLRSSLAIGKRLSHTMESRKKTMTVGMDQLDRQVVTEARELQKRGVYFVTHQVPVSLVRMVLPRSQTDAN